MNDNYDAMESPKDQQYLPPLVLCEKNRNTFSLISGKDYFTGEDMYTTLKGGKRQAREERVIVLGKLALFIK